MEISHASETKHRTLDEAINGADVFLGLICKRSSFKRYGKKYGKKSYNFCLC